ncbi:MAG: TetR/AcrR family transcriptional regulator [Pseudomonadota bacterium]
MPRPLGFDLDAARAGIMRVFWERGYAGASLGDLERATSLVRTSLYNSFGKKPEMFLESLRLYHDAMADRMDAAVKDRGVEALAEVVSAMIEGADETVGQPAGCLMVGAATQSGALEGRHLELVRAYRRMLVRTARDVLERDRASGRLVEGVDPDGAAELLVCAVWGALAAQCLGEGAPPTASAAFLRTMIAGWIRD